MFGYYVGKIKSLGFEHKFDVKSDIDKTFENIRRLLSELGFREFQKEI